jgi:hypothetical protein
MRIDKTNVETGFLHIRFTYVAKLRTHIKIRTIEHSKMLDRMVEGKDMQDRAHAGRNERARCRAQPLRVANNTKMSSMQNLNLLLVVMEEGEAEQAVFFGFT